MAGYKHCRSCGYEAPGNFLNPYWFPDCWPFRSYRSSFSYITGTLCGIRQITDYMCFNYDICLRLNTHLWISNFYKSSKVSNITNIVFHLFNFLLGKQGISKDLYQALFLHVHLDSFVRPRRSLMIYDLTEYSWSSARILHNIRIELNLT